MDEQLHSDVELEQDELYDDEQVYVGNEAPKIQAPPHSHNSDDPDADQSAAPAIPAATAVIPPRKLSETSTLEERQERFFLYLILSVSTGILICLFVIIVRFIVNRRSGDSCTASSSTDGTGGSGAGGGDCITIASKMQPSTTGETVLSSRASGDVEMEQKWNAAAAAAALSPSESTAAAVAKQTRLPSLLRDEVSAAATTTLLKAFYVIKSTHLAVKLENVTIMLTKSH